MFVDQKKITIFWRNLKHTFRKNVYNMLVQ